MKPRHHQLTFKPKLDPDKIKDYFRPLDSEDTILTLDELQRGLTGLWRGLGESGYLSPETAGFIVKSVQSIEETKYIQLRTEHQRMKNQQLATELGLEGTNEPINEHKPENK